MSELFLVNDPNYWKNPVKPRGFIEWAEMYEGNGQIVGLWELIQFDPRTGKVNKRIFNKNVITDQGANYMLQRALNSSSASLPNLFNNVLITNNSGSTTLTTALTNGVSSGTSLAVAALPAAIPSGTTIQVGFGTGQTQNFVTTALAVQGATSISVTAQNANATYAIGTAVVPIPQVTDNPNNAGLTGNATTPLSQYSGNLPTTAFTYTPTSGAGNRTALVSFTFANASNGGSTANGNYTDAWIVNVNTGATTNNYLAHEINSPMTCNNANSIQTNVTVKV
jgi:hypothetical protein